MFVTANLRGWTKNVGYLLDFERESCVKAPDQIIMEKMLGLQER